MWLETVCKSESNAEECPTCGGSVRRRAYSEMYAGAFIQNGTRLEIRRKPFEGYADPIILDPLTQYFDGGLFRCSQGFSLFFHAFYCPKELGGNKKAARWRLIYFIYL